VATQGVLPDSGTDVVEAVQRIIDQTGKSGGGVIFFPQGEYCFNGSGEKKHLHINYDNIVLRGEGTSTVFRLCRQLSQVEEAPWLTPALIETGMALQGTERFWGGPYTEHQRE